MELSKKDIDFLVSILKKYIDTSLATITNRGRIKVHHFEEQYMRTVNGGLPLDQSLFRTYLQTCGKVNVWIDSDKTGELPTDGDQDVLYFLWVGGNYVMYIYTDAYVLITTTTQIDDLNVSGATTYSSQKIEELFSSIGGDIEHDSTLNKNSNEDFLHINRAEKTNFVTASDFVEDFISHATDILYADLLDLIANDELIPSSSYRITDYTTTTVQADTTSAGHNFDIIVTALSTNELSENAKCVRKVGDAYFTNAKLEAWEIKYCIENDTSRFGWADTENGKGVIYYMKDEWNNECAYDFKNIQFIRKLTDGYLDEDNGVFIYVYTFTWFDENNEVNDLSLIGNELTNDEGYKSGIFNNTIKETTAYSVYFEINTPLFVLGGNVFLYHHSFESGLFYGCFNNSLGVNCYSNNFGDSCYSNNFGDSCYSNDFGKGCVFNTFGNNCTFNNFGNNCTFKNFGNNCNHNTFGNACSYNTFGDSCSSNNFYTGTSGTTKKDYIRYIVLEEGCRNNNFYSTLITSDADYLQRIRIKGLDNTTPTNVQITLSEANTKYEWLICYTSDGTLKQYCPDNNDTYKLEDTDVDILTWAVSNKYTGFGYQAQINIPNLTEDDFVNVVFGVDEAVSGNYAPAIEQNTGYILVFSKVNTAITIPTISVTKIDL